MSRGDALVWLQNQGGENYATLQSLGMPEENALDASAALAYNRAKRARETTTTVGFLAGVGGLAIGWIVWGRKRK